MSAFFYNTFGRSSKELYTMLGELVLQQTFDLTDMETVEQFAFNLLWHYALNITEETDSAKYLCPRTLWSMRTLVAKKKLDEEIFNEGTKRLIPLRSTPAPSASIPLIYSPI